MSIMTTEGIYLRGNVWHTVTRATKWRLGRRVIGFVHPSGRKYKEEAMQRMHWTDFARRYTGTLIKNEWNEGSGIIYPRYTVKCDDGKIRKFQYIKAI